MQYKNQMKIYRKLTIIQSSNVGWKERFGTKPDYLFFKGYRSLNFLWPYPLQIFSNMAELAFKSKSDFFVIIFLNIGTNLFFLLFCFLYPTQLLGQRGIKFVRTPTIPRRTCDRPIFYYTYPFKAFFC